MYIVNNWTLFKDTQKTISEEAVEMTSLDYNNELIKITDKKHEKLVHGISLWTVLIVLNDLFY